MKQILWIIILVLLTFQSQNSEAQSSKKEFIATSQVPSKIKNLQEALYPAKYVENWQTVENAFNDIELYICNFKQNTRDGYSSIYSPNGTFIYEALFLNRAQLTETVVIKTREMMDSFEIQNGYLLKTVNPKLEFYSVNVLDGFRKQTLYFNLDGIRIPEQNIPIELQLFHQ